MPITPFATVHELEFSRLSGGQFERLVFAFLLYRWKNWRSLNWTGERGADGGRDIEGVRRTRNGRDELLVVACANWRQTSRSKFQSDIDKILRRSRRPDHLILVTGGGVASTARTAAITRAAAGGIPHTEVWSGAEFEEHLRRHAPLVLKRILLGEVLPEAPDDIHDWARSTDSTIGSTAAFADAVREIARLSIASHQFNFLHRVPHPLLATLGPAEYARALLLRYDRRSLDKLLRTYPTNADALLASSRLLYLRGRYGDAVHKYLRISRISSLLPNQRTELLRNLSNIFSDLGFHDRASDLIAICTTAASALSKPSLTLTRIRLTYRSALTAGNVDWRPPDVTELPTFYATAVRLEHAKMLSTLALSGDSQARTFAKQVLTDTTAPNNELGNDVGKVIELQCRARLASPRTLNEELLSAARLALGTPGSHYAAYELAVDVARIRNSPRIPPPLKRILRSMLEERRAVRDILRAAPSVTPALTVPDRWLTM